MSFVSEHHRKVHEDSPDRCQANCYQGQCLNVKVPGCDFCLAHSGHKQDEHNRNVEKRNYRLVKFQARVGEFADNEKVKSLREEVGISRMMLEEVLNKCEDTTDLLMYSERISKLMTQIQGLVLSCQKLEEKAGSLLDKTQVFVICENIVKIIGDHVTDPDVLDMIANKIMDMMRRSVTTNPLDD